MTVNYPAGSTNLASIVAGACGTASSIMVSQAEIPGSSRWELEIISPQRFDEVSDAVAGLAQRALQANVFFEPAFAAAAMERLGEPALRLVMIWERFGDSRQLRFFAPFESAYIGIPKRKVFRVWSHPFAPLGTVLLDAQEAAESARKFFQLLRETRDDRPQTFAITDCEIEGPVAEHLLRGAAEAGYCAAALPAGNRVVLQPRSAHEAAGTENITKKRRKEHARQLRRLADIGTVEFRRAVELDKVFVGFEEFLLLETRGWKGRNGSSLHTIKRTAAFARQAAYNLCLRQQCSIYSLRLDGRPIAALFAIHSNGTAYPWKIAYDETHREFSPGLQLMLFATNAWLSDPDFCYADSLANDDHPMISNIWPDRAKTGTLLFTCGRDAEKSLRATRSAISRSQMTKSWLKSQLTNLRILR